MPGTSTTTPPAQRVARRDRAAHAFTLAYARRGGDMSTVGPWLLGYLESCVAGGMTTAEIADTARGIADAWKATCEEIAAELDANIAAATNQPGATS